MAFSYFFNFFLYKRGRLINQDGSWNVNFKKKSGGALLKSFLAAPPEKNFDIKAPPTLHPSVIKVCRVSGNGPNPKDLMEMESIC